MDEGGPDAAYGVNLSDQVIPESKVFGSSDFRTVSTELSDDPIASIALEGTEPEAYAMLVDEVLGEEDALGQGNLQVLG